MVAVDGGDAVLAKVTDPELVAGVTVPNAEEADLADVVPGSESGAKHAAFEANETKVEVGIARAFVFISYLYHTPFHPKPTAAEFSRSQPISTLAQPI